MTPDPGQLQPPKIPTGFWILLALVVIAVWACGIGVVMSR